MLILLDIDGVMVPAAGWKVPALLNDGFPDFSHKSVNGLKKIIAATGASILLTTSHKSKYTVTAWKSIFAKRGIHATISKLKTKGAYSSRKDEVLNWVKTHKTDRDFIIIDDDKSLNDLPVSIKRNLILTSPLVGLNENLADKAILALHHNSTSISA